MTKNKLRAIKRLKAQKEMLQYNMNSIKQAIERIDKKLFTIIVGKE
jgi:hypothetical protein